MPTPCSLYTDLSSFYDLFCAEVDYEAQSSFTQRVFACFASSNGRDYLDLACGTGQHMEWMERYGFAATGLDNSTQMLERAGLRCPSAQLMLCDLAAFEQYEIFDLITCFLYSIHYSHPVAALTETVRRAWRALKPGGIFLFNAVDAHGISNDSGVTTWLEDREGMLSFRSAWNYRGAGDVLDLNLVITRHKEKEALVWHDHHVMTAVSLLELRELLQATGFEVVMLEHDYSSMQPWNNASFNAIFVACKPHVHDMPHSAIVER